MLFLTSISDDNIKLTRFLLDILGSSLVILFIPRVELYSVDIGVFGREVFEGLSGWVAGTCEDDGVGAFGDGGGEAETNTTVSTRDYTSQLGREAKGEWKVGGRTQVNGFVRHVQSSIGSFRGFGMFCRTLGGRTLRESLTYFEEVQKCELLWRFL